MNTTSAPKRQAAPSRPDAPRPGWSGWTASLLLALSFVARILEHFVGTSNWALAAGLTGLFVVVFLATPLTASRSRWLAHLCCVLQSTLIVGLLCVPPSFDGVTALFVALALQAALIFETRALVAWIVALTLLTIVPAMFVFGWVQGLALMVTPAVGCVLLPAYVVAHREIEAARLDSQRLLEELQAAQHRLQAFADQAEELAAVEARHRLARELHDSVLQTLFSLSLNVRAARLCLERDPARLRPQLERLQTLAQDALGEIRGLIKHLRPAGGVP